MDDSPPKRARNAVPEDRLLIERARRGDVRAFEQVYRTYAGRVHAICLRLAGPDGAEDLVQEVFLRLWQRLESFRGQSSFYSWLYRLTMNLAIDHVRSRTRRWSRESEEEDPDRFRHRGPSGSAVDRMDLERAVASLPDGARVVFVLHDVEGFRHEDIAAMTGMASGTCRAQLHRARRLLRDRLNR